MNNTIEVYFNNTCSTICIKKIVAVKAKMYYKTEYDKDKDVAKEVVDIAQIIIHTVDGKEFICYDSSINKVKLEDAQFQCLFTAINYCVAYNKTMTVNDSLAEEIKNVSSVKELADVIKYRLATANQTLDDINKVVENYIGGAK